MMEEEEIIDVVEDDHDKTSEPDGNDDHLVPNVSPLQAYSARLNSETDYARSVLVYGHF